MYQYQIQIVNGLIFHFTPLWTNIHFAMIDMSFSCGHKSQQIMRNLQLQDGQVGSYFIGEPKSLMGHAGHVYIVFSTNLIPSYKSRY